MIIAGPCLHTEKKEEEMIYETARQLNGIVTHFRCKLWGGGTTPIKYLPGIGRKGLDVLRKIQKDFNLSVGTEVQTFSQMFHVCELDYLWVGARNCQNYTFLKELSWYKRDLLIKRHPGITIDETIGIFDIMKKIHNKEVFIIERGVNTFDRLENSRWAPDLKGVIRLKVERPDVFSRLIIDCSHSVGRKEYIKDTYNAFKSIGVKHFMFECTASGESRTDSRQMLSVEEFKNILRGQ